jgi:hypothetical protein
VHGLKRWGLLLLQLMDRSKFDIAGVTDLIKGIVSLPKFAGKEIEHQSQKQEN